jgi:hypothetical protein
LTGFSGLLRIYRMERRGENQSFFPIIPYPAACMYGNVDTARIAEVEFVADAEPPIQTIFLWNGGVILGNLGFCFRAFKMI